jgi:hypothetical protein
MVVQNTAEYSWKHYLFYLKNEIVNTYHNLFNMLTKFNNFQESNYIILLWPLPIPYGPWKSVSMDFYGEFFPFKNILCDYSGGG